MKEYAVYKGDKLLAIGTAKECAKELNVNQETIYWLCNPSVHKKSKGNRTLAYRLDD